MVIRASLLRPDDPSGGYLDDRDDDANVTVSALLAIAAVVIFFFVVICFYAFTNLLCIRKHHQDSNSATSSSSAVVSVSAPADPGSSTRPTTPSLSLTGSFPLLSASVLREHTECVVCLNELEEGDVLRLLPACNHTFHPECIDAWMFSHASCPLCRCSVLTLPADKNAEDGPPSLIPVSQEENGNGLRAVAIAMDIADAAAQPPLQTRLS